MFHRFVAPFNKSLTAWVSEHGMRVLQHHPLFITATSQQFPHCVHMVVLEFTSVSACHLSGIVMLLEKTSHSQSAIGASFFCFECLSPDVFREVVHHEQYPNVTIRVLRVHTHHVGIHTSIVCIYSVHTMCCVHSCTRKQVPTHCVNTTIKTRISC